MSPLGFAGMVGPAKTSCQGHAQKTYFTANCMMRGSPAVVICPNTFWLRFVFGFIRTSRFVRLKASTRISSRVSPIGNRREIAVSTRQFPGPSMLFRRMLPESAKRRLHERAGVQEIQAVAIEVRIPEDLVGPLIVDGAERPILAAENGHVAAGCVAINPSDAPSARDRAKHRSRKRRRFDDAGHVEIVAPVRVTVATVELAVVRIDIGIHAAADVAAQARVVADAVRPRVVGAKRQTAHRAPLRRQQQPMVVRRPGVFLHIENAVELPFAGVLQVQQAALIRVGCRRAGVVRHACNHARSAPDVHRRVDRSHEPQV